MIRRLSFLSETLSELSQDESERPRGLCDTVSALVSPALIKKFSRKKKNASAQDGLHASTTVTTETGEAEEPATYDMKEQDAQQTVIELLICRCVTEVLRIYAPEAPYNTDCLLQIFQLV